MLHLTVDYTISSGILDQNPFRTLRQASRRANVICIHPISGMVTSYAKLVRALPKTVNVYGIEADKEFDRKGLRVGITDLAARYASWIEVLAQSGPTAVVGWCIGADIALEAASLLQGSAHPIRYVVAIDPNFAVDKTTLAKGTVEGGANATVEYWKFFILMTCGAVNVDVIYDSDEFKALRSDRERVEHIYKMRRELTTRAGIEIYEANPCWQFEFMKELTDQSRNYGRPSDIGCHALIIAADRDRERAVSYLRGMQAPSLTLSLFKSDHYAFMESPIINSIGRSICAHIE